MGVLFIFWGPVKHVCDWSLRRLVVDVSRICQKSLKKSVIIEIYLKHIKIETSRFYMPTKFHLIVFFFINLFGIVDVYIKIIFILLHHSTASRHGLFASRAAHRQKKKQYILFFVSPQEFDWYEKFISCLIGCFYPWIWFDIKQFLYLIFGSR